MKLRFPLCRSRRVSAKARGPHAFTLVELLVSMVVLSLLLAMVSQMVNGTLSVSTNSTKRLDMDSQVRLVFDRMAVDFSQIVKRSDVDYFFQKNPASPTAMGLPGEDDQMAFYSETTGYFPAVITGPVPKSNAALVGYCIRNNTSVPTTDPTYKKRQLVRLSKALVWNGVSTTGAMTFLPQTLLTAWPTVFSGGSTPATADMTGGTDPEYQVIGEQVFRMELSYLMRYSSTSTILSDTPYLSTNVQNTSTPNVLPFNAMRDVVAVVVSVAVLDNTSRQLVQPADLDTAAAALQDVNATTFAQAPTKTPAQYWQAALVEVNGHPGNSLSRTNGGSLPPAVAGQVHVYERYFYLGNAQ